MNDEKVKILLCEDDENLGMLLREYLQVKGYDTDLMSDGDAGLKAFMKNTYDVCVFDVMMPKKDGWQVCREIREISGKPVIMITAKGEVFDKILGLELGADDYILKPFNPDVLHSKVKRLIKNRIDLKQTYMKLMMANNTTNVTEEEKDRGIDLLEQAKLPVVIPEYIDREKLVKKHKK